VVLAGVGAVRSAGGEPERVPRALAPAREPGAAEVSEQRCAAGACEGDPRPGEGRVRLAAVWKELLAKGIRVGKSG